MPSRTYVCYRLRNLPRGATSPKAPERRFRTPEAPPVPASVSSQRLFAELDLLPKKPRVTQHCRARLENLWRPPSHGHPRYHQSWELRHDGLDAFLTRERLILHGERSTVRRAARHFEERAPGTPDFPALDVPELDVLAIRAGFPSAASGPGGPDAATVLVPYKGRNVEVRVTRRGRFVFKHPEPPEIAVGVIRKIL